MLLLPVARTLGVLGISEVVLVLRPSQPSPHQLAFPGFAALGFKTVALAMSSATIGKKEFLTVQALASALGGFIGSTGNENHYAKTARDDGRNPPGRRLRPEKKEEEFSANPSKKSKGRRSHSRPSVLHPFHFNGGMVLLSQPLGPAGIHGGIAGSRLLRP